MRHRNAIPMLATKNLKVALGFEHGHEDGFIWQ